VSAPHHAHHPPPNPMPAVMPEHREAITERVPSGSGLSQESASVQYPPFPTGRDPQVWPT
jgi:hypothetical protein